MRARFPLIALIVPAALSACVGGGGRSGPGDIPVDAVGAMYTDLPPEQLATCFARAIGGSVQPSGTRFLVTSPTGGATYDVGANAAGGVFPTELVVRGVGNATEQQRGGHCFTALAPAR